MEDIGDIHEDIMEEPGLILRIAFPEEAGRRWILYTSPFPCTEDGRKEEAGHCKDHQMMLSFEHDEIFSRAEIFKNRKIIFITLQIFFKLRTFMHIWTLLVLGDGASIAARKRCERFRGPASRHHDIIGELYAILFSGRFDNPNSLNFEITCSKKTQEQKCSESQGGRCGIGAGETLIGGDGNTEEKRTGKGKRRFVQGLPLKFLAPG